MLRSYELKTKLIDVYDICKAGFRNWIQITKLVNRVIQEESAILWEMIICVILSKNVHMNMGPILKGYRDYGKKKIRTILRAQTAIM
jgi:hypothetical protein